MQGLKDRDRETRSTTLQTCPSSSWFGRAREIKESFRRHLSTSFEVARDLCENRHIRYMVVVRAAALHPSHSPRACMARTCRPSCSLEFVDAYQQLLDTAPFPTKAITQGVIWGMSDITAQVQARGAYSAQRTRNFALQGVGSGVLWALYYDWADAVVSPAPGGPVAHTVLSIMLEQFSWCPLLFAFYQIPFSVLLNGGTLTDVPPAIQRQLNGLLVEYAKVWTPANLIIYNVPLEWRLLSSNVVDFVWGYISSGFAAEACAPDDEACILDAEDELSGFDAARDALVSPRAVSPRVQTGVGVRRYNLGRGLPRLLTRRLKSAANRAWIKDA